MAKSTIWTMRMNPLPSSATPNALGDHWRQLNWMITDFFPLWEKKPWQHPAKARTLLRKHIIVRVFNSVQTNSNNYWNPDLTKQKPAQFWNKIHLTGEPKINLYHNRFSDRKDQLMIQSIPCRPLVGGEVLCLGHNRYCCHWQWATCVFWFLSCTERYIVLQKWWDSTTQIDEWTKTYCKGNPRASSGEEMGKWGSSMAMSTSYIKPNTACFNYLGQRPKGRRIHKRQWVKTAQEIIFRENTDKFWSCLTLLNSLGNSLYCLLDIHS